MVREPPDHHDAEMVLKLGGVIQLENNGFSIVTSVADLPDGPIRLRLTLSWETVLDPAAVR